MFTKKEGISCSSKAAAGVRNQHKFKYIILKYSTVKQHSLDPCTCKDDLFLNLLAPRMTFSRIKSGNKINDGLVLRRVRAERVLDIKAVFKLQGALEQRTQE